MGAHDSPRRQKTTRTFRLGVISVLFGHKTVKQNSCSASLAAEDLFFLGVGNNR